MTESVTKEFVREAYVLSDLRFQAVLLLVEAFGLEKVTALLAELGGMRLKRSEAEYPGYLSLGPVLRRTLGENWLTIFQALGVDVVTLPTLSEYLEAERDVEAYCLVRYSNRVDADRTVRRKPTAEEANRARRVKVFLEQAGLEF